MSLGRIALVTAGVAVGIFVGYAVKSEKIRPAAVSAVKAGLKAKDWTVGQYDNIRNDVKSLTCKARESFKRNEAEENNEAAEASV